MISKGKRQYLVRTYACLDFIRKMCLPNGGIDILALCAHSARLTHVREPVKSEPFDFDKFLETAVGSSESWETVGKMVTEICDGVLRRQEQQVVHKH